jgi:UDP-MurNAc hydroxylase
MRIDTPAGSILTDPWVNPAYFASWFPFPDNSELDWESLGKVDYLYVSHLHRDHFDHEHLKRFVDKKATVLLPAYPTSELEDELRDVGFTKFIKTVSNEVVELDGGLKIMIQALTSPTDGPIGDSSLWVEYDGIRLLNQNDARPTDLSEFAKLGHVHAHMLQFSGAIWYPMVYELPEAAKTAFGKQKRERQFDRTWRYIDDLKASWVFPIAGPPCFLDDELWQFNDIFGDEGNIFPDQSVFLREYRAIGRDNAVVLLPGSVATLTADDCTVTHPVPDLDEFFANKEQYLRDYRDRKRAVIDAAKASWSHPEIDVLAEMKRRIEPLLEESIYLAKGVRSASTCSPTTTRPWCSPSWSTSRPSRCGRPRTRRCGTASGPARPWWRTCWPRGRWTGSTRCSCPAASRRPGSASTTSSSTRSSSACRRSACSTPRAGTTSTSGRSTPRTSRSGTARPASIGRCSGAART